jgi:hypothetical protein
MYTITVKFITLIITVIIILAVLLIYYYPNSTSSETKPTVETFTESYTPNIEMNLGGGSLTAANVTGTTKVKAGNAELANNNIKFVGGTTTVLSPGKLMIGNTTIENGKICIGGACLDQTRIEKLTGKKTINIQSAYEQNGDGKGWLARKKGNNDVATGNTPPEDPEGWPKFWYIR